MSWLDDFAKAAENTDRFAGNEAHVELLAVGLLGEAGSVLAELKKEQRERDAYPAYRRRLEEELGDFLWYFVRLISLADEALLAEAATPSRKEPECAESQSLPLFLQLGAAVGSVLASVTRQNEAQRLADLRPLLRDVWSVLYAISEEVQIPLESAAERNIGKIESRWPRDRAYSPLFDGGFPEEEQLPRRLEIEFRERTQSEPKVVLLRCNGINFGDRLTDNIQDPDGYRYHDIFHFSYAVHLGWSPVVRSLLRCKRKSVSEVDENEDGARAAILEEAIAAIVFNRAKELNFFDGLDHIEYGLLKTVSEFVKGYEVARIPLWQWETAILDGYAIFRKLRSNHGGSVILDLDHRQLSYIAPR